ncbi:MAG: zinc-binding dehydrogenase [Chloroflexi bacterium]|nr:zinc-binding dehydrogenase [Chloroflexota bacterium]
MKTARIHSYGGPEVLTYEGAPEPVAGPGEVVVELRGASVNRLDLRLRAGQTRFQLSFPWTLGLDGAGVVVEVGPGATGVEVGAEVVVAAGISCGRCYACLTGHDNLCSAFGLVGIVRPGTYAERVAVPAANVAPKPAALSFHEAAAFPLVFTTAWQMLSTVARLREGETVLVQAAGSGVGSSAIQVARLLGGRVLATAGSDEKLAKARELGAEATVNYSWEDFVEAARRFSDGRGVDVVIENVGGEVLARSLEALRPGGRLVTCGTTAGATAPIDYRAFYTRQLSMTGVYVGRKADLLEALAQAALGHLRPVVHRAFPLREAAEAHRLLESRTQFGKLVLVP